MKLGTVHSFEDIPGAEIGHQAIYENGIAQVLRSEELGYDWVNITEHHVTDDGYCPAVLPVLGALAAATSTIGLSTGMIVLTLHHPIRIAEEAAVVDLISGGRLTLGVTAGYRKVEFEAFGVPHARRGQRLDEGIEIMKLAWAGKPFSYEGEVFDIPEVSVLPRPAQRPGLPLWMGGLSQPALRRVARHGAPCFPGATHTQAEAADGLMRLRAIREEEGLDGDPEMILPRLAYIADTMEEARRHALPAITAMFDRYVAYGVPEEAKVALTDWDLLDQYVIVGDEEHCARKVDELREIGVTDLMLQLSIPTLDPARAMEATERFPRAVRRKE